MAREFLEQYTLLLLIDLLDGLQNSHPIAALLGGADQRAHILREARASVAATRVEELLADARVGTNALAHHIHVGSHPLAQIGNIVHKRDARGEHRIGRVLGHLGRGNIHKQHAEIIYQERAVELREELSCALALNAHHNSVGRHKILHGSALLQEFGIRRHIELHIHTPSLQLLADGLLGASGRTDGNGRFDDEERIALDEPSHLAGYGHHLTQVGRAILVGRRTHGGEDHLHLRDALLERGGEAESACSHVAFDDLLQAGLIDGHLATA